MLSMDRFLNPTMCNYWKVTKIFGFFKRISLTNPTTVTNNTNRIYFFKNQVTNLVCCCAAAARHRDRSSTRALLMSLWRPAPMLLLRRQTEAVRAAAEGRGTLAADRNLLPVPNFLTYSLWLTNFCQTRFTEQFLKYEYLIWSRTSHWYKLERW